ncbi:MAG: 3-keto-5-aminohexanoate cleavage protein [Myxococcota bacterium]
MPPTPPTSPADPAPSRDPVILEVAVNGTTQPARNPNVPRTPAEIAAEMIRCIEAGATILHNHNDDPIFDGLTASHEAAPYIEAWGPVLEAHPDVFLYPTMTGGGSHTTIEQRYGHIPEIAAAGLLRMGLVDPGSVNLGIFEGDGAPDASEMIYLNSNADIRHMVDTSSALGLPMSFSIFDGSFMRTAVAYAQSGRVKNGGIIKLYFGSSFAPFGLPATEAALMAYLDILGDCPLPWSVAVLGGDVLKTEMARIALEHGGHLRVGLEDYAGPGQPSNTELIERAKALCKEVGRPIATPSEAALQIRSAVA